jgi:hypothetical protein
VPRYQTEIVIPPDRYVCLQMPAHFPEGNATVTVLVDEPVGSEAVPPREADPDRQDIEWWEEFEDEAVSPVDDGDA